MLTQVPTEYSMAWSTTASAAAPQCPHIGAGLTAWVPPDHWVFSETRRMNPQVSVSRLAKTRKWPGDTVVLAAARAGGGRLR